MPIQELKVKSCEHYEKGACPLEAKSIEIAEELQHIKEEVADIKCDVHDIVTLFKESQAALGFAVKLGKLVRWLALTLASITAVWAALTNWPKH